MGPIKTIKKKKRVAEKKVDRNVLLAAAAATASASAAAASTALHSDDSSSQPLDWWDGFSRRISGISRYCFCFGGCALVSFMVFEVFSRIELQIVDSVSLFVCLSINFMEITFLILD